MRNFACRYFHLRRTRLVASAILLAVLGWAAAAPAFGAFVITPTFDSSITSDPNAAAIEGTINTAISIYEAKFTDPITVNIKFQEITSGLGQSSTIFFNVAYSAYLAALSADAKTSNDTTALAHLPAGPNNPVNGNATINVTSANLRAVGITANPLGGFDGIIGLNTSITSPGSPGTASLFSLLVVVEHHIDEVLGLLSSLPSTPFGTIFPEDLYRYDSAGNRSFTTNVNAQAFFSIDTTTDLAQFDNQNQGTDFGDWQSNPLPSGVQPEVQDAVFSPGATPALGVELTALDVIGYDLSQQATPVPEAPATVAIFLALGMIGVAIDRIRVKVTKS
jgi:hypothetical protein